MDELRELVAAARNLEVALTERVGTLAEMARIIEEAGRRVVVASKPFDEIEV